jgi:hypothetical protein
VAGLWRGFSAYLRDKGAGVLAMLRDCRLDQAHSLGASSAPVGA